MLQTLETRRHGATGTGVRFKDVDRVLADRVLDVHQADDAQLDSDLAVVLIDRVDVFGGDADGRDHAGRVARVNAGQLDVLHDRRHERVFAVGNRVGLDLDGVFEELVDQDRTFGSDVDGYRHVAAQHLLVVDHFHGPASENEGRTHHERIADLSGDFQGLVEVGGHAGFGLRDSQLTHHLAETDRDPRPVRWHRETCRES